MAIPAQPNGTIRRPAAMGSVEKVLYDILDQLMTQANYVAQYMPAAIDDAGDPAYYGFYDPSGHYYIQKIAGGIVTYYTGKDPANFAADWTNRAALIYLESYQCNFQ